MVDWELLPVSIVSFGKISPLITASLGFEFSSYMVTLPIVKSTIPGKGLSFLQDESAITSIIGNNNSHIYDTLCLLPPI